MPPPGSLSGSQVVVPSVAWVAQARRRPRGVQGKGKREDTCVAVKKVYSSMAPEASDKGDRLGRELIQGVGVEGGDSK